MTRSRHDPEELAACLKSLGLTRYEALVYIALLRVTSATAGEIHESSGVPRASVYPVLDQLLEKDMVSVSLSSPKRFAAVPPDQGIGKLTARIERNAADALEGLTAIYRKRLDHGQGGGEIIWNLQGMTAIRKRLAELVAGADREIRIIAHSSIFSDEIKKALKKKSEHAGVEIVTSRWDGPVPDSMQVIISGYHRLPKSLDQIKDIVGGGICIIDDRKGMVIIGSGDEDAVALYSESEGFVRFFLRYYSLIMDWTLAKQD
jgi:sugar-specific transcriptional regulator TrmB